MKPLLFLRTLSYLRAEQISSRISLLARRYLLQRSALYQRRYQANSATYGAPNPLLLPAAETPVEVDGIAEGVFTLLNQTMELGRPVDWVPDKADALWLYQLHSFEYLLPLGIKYQRELGEGYYGVFRDLVSEWVEDSPVGASPSWDPYPTSLRIRNWLHAYRLFAPALRLDNSFDELFLSSLHSQTRYLEDFLEFHLLGNHLIENGRALLLAGLFFQGKTAGRWRRKGEEILWQQLDLQFLSDGGHNERSPMYHLKMLELYREVEAVLANLGALRPKHLDNRLAEMKAWLSAVIHPDGDIPLLNDAVLTKYQTVTPAISESSERDGLTPLAQSGYYAFRDSCRGDLAIFDCGALGPDHQPGHGHCDCLSFELSVSDLRIVVDSGVGTYYGDQAWRNYYRSTRAHNTIQIDGVEQSEIWGRFRVGLRAAPVDVRWSSDDYIEWVRGSHTGYRRLPGNLTHQRWFCWVDRKFWLVLDRVTGRGEHVIDSFLHFHPEVEVSVPVCQGDLFVGDIKRRNVSIRAYLWGIQSVRLVCGDTREIQAWYAPDFNCQLPNSVWALRRETGLPVWLACILCPDTCPPTMPVVGCEKNELRAKVEFGDRQYQVVCDGSTIWASRE